ncbi:MAG: glycosyltransferase family 2 protein [Candidatus Hodarchaeales archaeon]|jgi:hypothetical protein
MSQISITCVLPVLNETYSLDFTVQYLEKFCRKEIVEFLIIICDKTANNSLTICNYLKKRYFDKIKIHKQSLPYLGGALQEAFKLAIGSHVLLMGSDLETDPRTVPLMINELKTSKNDIILTSRWLKGGGFADYGPVKRILNFFFQNFFSILYQSKLTDLTYAFRIYDLRILKLFEWEDLKHPFLFECIIKPLRFNFKISEIPTFWQARTEGKSSNKFAKNFQYFSIGLRTRFRMKEKLLQPKYRHLVKTK